MLIDRGLFCGLRPKSVTDLGAQLSLWQRVRAAWILMTVPAHSMNDYYTLRLICFVFLLNVLIFTFTTMWVSSLTATAQTFVTSYTVCERFFSCQANVSVGGWEDLVWVSNGFRWFYSQDCYWFSYFIHFLWCTSCFGIICRASLAQANHAFFVGALFCRILVLLC